jgi:hypothetical protein
MERSTYESGSGVTRRFYSVYQFVVPLVLFPFAYWLWWERFDHAHDVTSLVLFVPVVAYYVFVIVGITKFRLWEMNTRPTICGFRPHHGFVLGTAAALLIYLCIRMVPVEQTGFTSVLTAAFLGASVFGFWNWWYETYAIKTGFISIYTKKIADGASAEEAVTDYAPVLFGSMGACYGAMVKTAENLLLVEHSPTLYWLIALTGGLAIILVPTFAYLLTHRIKHGESGLKSYIEVIKPRKKA